MTEKKNGSIDIFIKFAPTIIAVVAFIITYRIVATPDDVRVAVDKLETKIAQTYATKEETKSLQRQYDNISVKIDRIYDYIITAKR